MNTDAYIDDDIAQQGNTMNESQLDEHEQSVERTISSRFIGTINTKEKQTGRNFDSFFFSKIDHEIFLSSRNVLSSFW